MLVRSSLEKTKPALHECLLQYIARLLKLHTSASLRCRSNALAYFPTKEQPEWYGLCARTSIPNHHRTVDDIPTIEFFKPVRRSLCFVAFCCGLGSSCLRRRTENVPRHANTRAHRTPQRDVARVRVSIEEQHRIHARTSHVPHINRVLQDANSQGLIATPELRSESVACSLPLRSAGDASGGSNTGGPLEFIILATDGLWDVVEDQVRA